MRGARVCRLLLAILMFAGVSACGDGTASPTEPDPPSVEGRFESTWTFLVRDSMLEGGCGTLGCYYFPRVYDTVTCVGELELSFTGDLGLPFEYFTDSVPELEGTLSLPSCTHAYGADPGTYVHGPLPPPGLLVPSPVTVVSGWAVWREASAVEVQGWSVALRLENESHSIGELLGCEAVEDTSKVTFGLGIVGNATSVSGFGGSGDVPFSDIPLWCGDHKMFVEVKIDLPPQPPVSLSGRVGT